MLSATKRNTSKQHLNKKKLDAERKKWQRSVSNNKTKAT